MPSYVCKGAKLKCSMGDTQSDLNVIHPSDSVSLLGEPMANIMDYKPMMNIMPFGKCQSLANPTVAAATAACFGRLQPMPCVPNITSPWSVGKLNVSVKGHPALLDDCKLFCAYAGVIEITTDGQATPGTVTTGATGIGEEPSDRLRKQIKAVEAYWMDNESDEKHYEIFPNHEVTLYIQTENYTEGETFTLEFLDDESQKFRGSRYKQKVSGTVDASGMVSVKNFKIEYEN